MGLGLSIVALSAQAFLRQDTLYLRLAAYSCLVIILLAFGTVATALWSGP
jgi:hypothetical protein